LACFFSALSAAAAAAIEVLRLMVYQPVDLS